MAIYQFLIAVRSGGQQQQSFMLTNADGETTSHIQGMFNRTIRYLTEGIKPIYVFDGKPPDMKSHELTKRKDRREKAQAALIAAQETGNVEELDKQSKRLVRAGSKENEDCIKLLQLMGVPVVKAPCEAEAQASYMAKTGLVYAAATEDMDALTFQTPVLIRKMTFANATKAVVQSVNYDKAISGLDITPNQFVDLCILLGCDYCDTIRGVGPKTALKLIREHTDIETILKKIDRSKFTIPESWIPNEGQQPEQQTDSNKKRKVINDDSENDEEFDDDNDGEDKRNSSDKKNSIEKENSQNLSNTVIEEDNENSKTDGNDDGVFIPAYVQARKLFQNHEVVTDDLDLKWKPCQVEELTKFLVDTMGFNIDRVKTSIDKLQIAYKANTKPQSRMDSFFTVTSISSSSKKSAGADSSATKGKASIATNNKKGSGTKGKSTASSRKRK
jgi:flap endonuclease-1